MEDFCNQCGLCCRFIPVDVTNRLLLRDSVQPLTGEFEAMLIPVDNDFLHELNENYSENVLNTDVKFFKCKYLLNGNVCFHPDKPKECQEFPCNAFAFIPDDCGYYGMQFVKNEEIKQKIRKMKEEIIDYEAMIACNPKEERAYKIIIDRLKKYINKYSAYGSSDW